MPPQGLCPQDTDASDVACSKTYSQWVTPSHPVKSVPASFRHVLEISFSIPGLMGNGGVCNGAGYVWRGLSIAKDNQKSFP